MEDHLLRWATGHHLTVQTGAIATLDGSGDRIAVFDADATHRFALTAAGTPAAEPPCS
jgi:hypothetical protein